MRSLLLATALLCTSAAVTFGQNKKVLSKELMPSPEYRMTMKTDKDTVTLLYTSELTEGIKSPTGKDVTAKFNDTLTLVFVDGKDGGIPNDTLNLHENYDFNYVRSYNPKKFLNAPISSALKEKFILTDFQDANDYETKTNFKNPSPFLLSILPNLKKSLPQ